jgi:hypothetical protein
MQETHIITSSLGKKSRGPITIAIGKEYKVIPLNDLKMKHRDRICTVTGFDDDFAQKKQGLSSTITTEQEKLICQIYCLSTKQHKTA